MMAVLNILLEITGGNSRKEFFYAKETIHIYVTGRRAYDIAGSLRKFFKRRGREWKYSEYIRQSCGSGAKGDGGFCRKERYLLD